MQLRILLPSLTPEQTVFFGHQPIPVIIGSLSAVTGRGFNSLQAP